MTITADPARARRDIGRPEDMRQIVAKGECVYAEREYVSEHRDTQAIDAASLWMALIAQVAERVRRTRPVSDTASAA